MMDTKVPTIVARALMASVFLGVSLAGLLGAFSHSLSFMAWVMILIELALGIVILIGWQTRWVALAVVAILIVEALTVHGFWRFGGAERAANLLHCLKNLSMAGGFLLLAIVDFERRARLKS